MPKTKNSPPRFFSKWFKKWKKKRPVVAVLRLDGVIGFLGPHRQGLTLEGLSDDLERAFDMPRVKAIALIINSPGGSPVQTSLIYERIRHLAEKNKIKVWTFIEDVAASGGYWLACAGDKIFADHCSIVGSIGVISGSFGFPKLIEKLGIERRVYTSGDSKSMLDPFLRENPEDVIKIKDLQQNIHERFKEIILTRRNKTLTKRKNSDLFSGRVWTGQQAKTLGLIDDLGHLRQIAENEWGKKVRMIRINKPPKKKGWARFFTKSATLFSAQPVKNNYFSIKNMGHDVLAGLKEWEQWERYM